MKKKCQRSFCIAAGLLVGFVLWTLFVRLIDVQAIGPLGSSVGFATLNGYVHRLTGVHMSLYHLTDWLSLIPIAIVLGFGVLGLWQWIRRKSLFAVDGSIVMLGIFYIVVMSFFVFFEYAVINYRPVLIEGRLEPSYPSSTTMLVMCVMPTAAMQLFERVKNRLLLRIGVVAIVAFVAFMVSGRLISGVHWLSDIIGGAMLSAALVVAYDGAGKLNLFAKKSI